MLGKHAGGVLLSIGWVARSNRVRGYSVGRASGRSSVGNWMPARSALEAVCAVSAGEAEAATVATLAAESAKSAIASARTVRGKRRELSIVSFLTHGGESLSVPLVLTMEDRRQVRSYARRACVRSP